MPLVSLNPDAAEQAYAALLQALSQARRDWHVVGIHSGGAWLAQRMAQDLALPSPGVLDISFYRDDFSRTGLHQPTRLTALPFDVDNATILLVDDMVLTGRTVRAAMNALFDFGRPARIDLAALIDLASSVKAGRELPITPTFVGAHMQLAQGQRLVLAQREGLFHLAMEGTG